MPTRELTVHFRQELIVLASSARVEPMVHNYEKEFRDQFKLRLEAALDAVPECPKDRGRAVWLAEKMDLSPKGVGKWLNGDSIPELAKIPKLASVADVSPEKLLFGSESAVTVIARAHPDKITEKSKKAAITKLGEALVEEFRELPRFEQHEALMYVEKERAKRQQSGAVAREGPDSKPEGRG